MRSNSKRNRVAFATSLGAGLLIAIGVGAFAAANKSSQSARSFSAVPSGISAAKAMNIFASQTASENIPQSAATALADLTSDRDGVPSSVLPGQADTSKAAVLLSDVGRSGWTLVAAPTAKGGVCNVVLDNNGNAKAGGCVDRLSDTTPASFIVTYGGADDPVLLSGLASDDVQSVEIDLNGVSHPATLRNNAFFYEPPIGEAAAMSSLEVTLKNGSTVSFAIHKIGLPTS